MPQPLTADQIADHARALGVSSGASAEEVKAAWHKAVRSAHPDLNGGQTDREMARINAAYDALKDGVPASRGTTPGSSFAQRTTRARSGQPIVRTYRLDPLLRSSLTGRVLKTLEARGDWTPGIFSRIGRALDARIESLHYCPQHIHIPYAVSHTGEHVLLHYRGNMQKGLNFIIAPRFALEDDGTIATLGPERPKIYEGKRSPDEIPPVYVRIPDPSFLRGSPETLAYGRFL